MIELETSLVELTYEHHTLHELPKEESRTEPEVINFIIEEAKHKEVKMVRKNVRDRFPNMSMTPLPDILLVSRGHKALVCAR